jgi:hypothetical protein
VTYRNGALRCDKPFCRTTLEHWSFHLAQEDARAAGWHVVPCDCDWADLRRPWAHQRDYCPPHFPQRRRDLETVRSPLL